MHPDMKDHLSSMPDALMNWMGNIERFIKLSSFNVSRVLFVAIELCILAVSSMLEVWVSNICYGMYCDSISRFFDQN